MGWTKDVQVTWCFLQVQTYCSWLTIWTHKEVSQSSFEVPDIWQVFFSMTYCLWKMPSVKPPNPVHTSFIKLAVWKYLSTELQWNWSPHSFCHTSTTAILFFLACLLPLLNCAAHLILKNKTKLTISLLCFNLSTGSQSHKEFSARQALSTKNVSWYCSILSLSSTLHNLPYSLLCYWYSQPPDSKYQTHCWFPHLFHNLFSPSTWNDFHLLWKKETIILIKGFDKQLIYFEF